MKKNNCVIQNAINNMNWYFFRTCVLCFFLLSLVKTIVKSAKYPVDDMPSFWKTITLFHKDEVPEIIKWAQYALTLPLHTCSCERVFSINQNLIVTRLTVHSRTYCGGSPSDGLPVMSDLESTGVCWLHTCCVNIW